MFSGSALQVCEGAPALLECTRPDTQISVQLANFGRFSLMPCNEEGIADIQTNCVNNATLRTMSGLCDGRQQCNFTVSAELFGDSCPGTPKYLDAKFRCVQVTTTGELVVMDG